MVERSYLALSDRRIPRAFSTQQIPRRYRTFIVPVVLARLMSLSSTHECRPYHPLITRGLETSLSAHFNPTARGIWKDRNHPAYQGILQEEILVWMRIWPE